MDRRGLAVKSSVISLSSRLLSALLAFICRKYFIMYLGTDLLGINYTLSQVLETLSLTELGFQTAIIFRLYKPLSVNNKNEVSKIVIILKKIYIFIGIIIMVMGVLFVPFLKNIITRVDVGFWNVYFVYFIMLLGTVSSYFLSYNRAILQADQKIYVINLIDCVFQILVSIFRLISIIIFHNFILFVTIGTIGIVGSNIALYIYYKKHYSWIETNTTIDKDILKSLIANTKDVFVGRMAGYVYSSTDNLVISAFVGTGWVGLIGNYSTITNAIKMVIMGLTSPIQSMLGNFAISKSCEETEAIMMKYGFIRFVIALFLVIPTMCMSDLFVSIFYGKEYIQPCIIIILLTLDLFLICMEGAVGELIDALGFFKQEKNMYVVYAVTNLLLSCIGAYFWGVVPVFVATILAQIIGWLWRSFIAYKYYFKSWKKFILYWIIQIKYVSFYSFCSGITFIFIKSLTFSYNYIEFLLCGVCIEIIIAVLFIIIYHDHEEYRYLKILLKKIWERNGI